MSSFEPAPAAGYLPHSIYGDVTSNDPREVLPPAAQKKFTALVQRASDLYSSTPKHEAIQEVAKSPDRAFEPHRLSAAASN